MANLSSLLKTKSIQQTYDSGNLERGKIYVFSPTIENYFPCVYDQCAATGLCHFCWWSPDQGTAIVEIWGAAGSGGKQCCCAGGVPGNPPAYSRKTLKVNQHSFMCGFVGQSCQNDTLCFMGCSEYTGICYEGKDSTGCMCAMGGRGGWAFCNTTASACTPYCRLLSCNFATTQTGDAGCGMVCNYTDYATAGFNATDWMACGYGGDVNCCGGFSCIAFLHCNSCCCCCKIGYLRTAPGIFSECSSTIQVNHACMHGASPGSGHYYPAVYQGLAGLSHSPTHGNPYNYCWGSGQYCGCYEYSRCDIKLGVGVPAMSASVSDSVRDHTMRGGMGAVRIQFIAD